MLVGVLSLKYSDAGFNYTRLNRSQQAESKNSSIPKELIFFKGTRYILVYNK
jgi:hypothetical protein